jgi:hypothetical protein
VGSVKAEVWISVAFMVLSGGAFILFDWLLAYVGRPEPAPGMVA